MKKNEKLVTKNLLMKEIKVLILSLVAILTVAGGIYYFTHNDAQVLTSVPDTDKLVREFSHKKGPDNAKVKIVEFYDPECEACSAFFPYIKDIISAHPDDIQLVVRYALYHGNSVLAAKATDAAGLQGKFWEYQELLFINQNEWSHQKGPASEFFVKYALDLKLDVEKFKIDMEDIKRMESISIDLEDGPKLGVNGTPTIFINGKKLEQINPNLFKETIDAELKK